jgi:hypothetical protein
VTTALVGEAALSATTAVCSQGVILQAPATTTLTAAVRNQPVVEASALAGAATRSKRPNGKSGSRGRGADLLCLGRGGAVSTGALPSAASNDCGSPATSLEAW